VDDKILHEACRKIFRAGKTEENPAGSPMRRYSIRLMPSGRQIRGQLSADDE